MLMLNPVHVKTNFPSRFGKSSVDRPKFMLIVLKKPGLKDMNDHI